MSEYEDIQEQLSAYLDGELSDEDARRVEAALGDDAGLANELAQLRKTRELLQSLPRERAGEDFAAKVMHAAADKGVLTGAQPWRPSALPNPWRRYFAAAALIVFAVGLGIYFSISIYDAGPASGPQSELAIKSPVVDEGMDAVGTIARDLGDLRDIAAKKPDVRLDESLEITEEDSPHALAPTPAEAESAPPPDRIPPSDGMLKGAMAERPAERPVAKGAPRRSRLKSVSGKAGSIVGAETGYARKGGRKEKREIRFQSRKGPSRPQDRPSAFLAGPQSTTKLVKLVAQTDNEIIYTDNLAVSQKQVEAVFLANAVEITPPAQRLLQPSQANLLPASHLNRKLEDKPTPPRQLQYVVYGTPNQLQRVRVQLQQDVRAKQTVSQLSVLPTRRNGQAQSAAQSMPVARGSILADAKGQKTTSTRQPQKGQATTKTAQKKLSLDQKSTTQPAAREFAKTAGKDQILAPQSQQQELLHARLLSNQAMLITLKVHHAAKK